MTTPSQDKIIDTLRKLKAQADSAAICSTQEEAQAFTEMLHRLLTKHKLDMTDIEFEQMEREQPVEKHYINYADYPDIEVRSTRIAWIERLAAFVARAHFCRILIHPSSSRITLVGRKEDTLVAEYMLITLQRAAEALADKATAVYRQELRRQFGHQTGPRGRMNGFRAAFIQAFVMRIANRLEELRRGDRTGPGTAMVRFNKQDAAVEKFMAEAKFSTSKALSTHIAHNGEGYRRGTKAADDVDLTGKAITRGESNGRNRLITE